ncbi:MAG: hypothetical protein ACQERC_10605 [Bacteroidota bacterium]
MKNIFIVPFFFLMFSCSESSDSVKKSTFSKTNHDTIVAVEDPTHEIDWTDSSSHSVMNDLIRKIELKDEIIVNETDDDLNNISIEDHRLTNALNKESKEESIIGLNEILFVKLKRKKPISQDDNLYYPSFQIQLWTFNDTAYSKSFYDRIRTKKDTPFFNKPPQNFLLRGSYIVYLKTRAELFRTELNELTEQIKSM